MFNRLIISIIFCASLAHSLDFKYGKRMAEDEFDTNDKLIFLQSVWRHGDRTPGQTFSTDKTVWPQGWGELTLKGMEQHVRLGKRLKARYTDTLNFTSNSYLGSQVYLRSTDMNRTILSAASNMVGFFSGKSGVDYPDSKDWPKNYIPVPVHTPVPFDNDYIANPYRECKRIDAILKLETPELKKIKEESKDLLDKLSELTNQTVDIWNVWSVRDAWFIDRLYNKSMPSGFTDELFNQTDYLNDEMDNYEFGIGTKPFKGFNIEVELKKARGGPLIMSIIDHIKAKIYCRITPSDKRDKKGTSLCRWMDNLRYYIYSGHDITIASLFAIFDFKETNFDKDGFPHYSACVTFELWQTPTSEYYVKVIYWVPASSEENERVIDLTPSISGCSKKCTLDAFIKRSAKYELDTSPEQLCNDVNIMGETSTSSPLTSVSPCLVSTTNSSPVKIGPTFICLLCFLLIKLFV